MVERLLLSGRYEVIGALGRGAMGVVHKCHDRLLDRIVAVKEMAAGLEEDPKLRRRFTKEAQAAARLNHHNIVSVYDLQEFSGAFYIVMELIDGVDLISFVKTNKPPLAVQLDLLLQLCDGLAHAHEQGIVHRDIKPGNLLVSATGSLTIVDFGIAHLMAATLTSDAVMGTPSYMAPEVAMGNPIDARTDLFTVGAVAYELLSGEKPFVAGSIPALLAKIIQEPHQSLTQRMPGLPPALTEIVDRLLSKNPDDRPSSAREVHEVLSAVAGRPVAAASRSDGPTSRQREMRPEWVAGILVVILGAGAIGGWLWLHEGKTPIADHVDRNVQESSKPSIPRPPTDDRATTNPPAAGGRASTPRVERGEDHQSSPVEGSPKTRHEIRRPGSAQTKTPAASPPIAPTSGAPPAERAPDQKEAPNGPGIIRVLATPQAEILLDGSSMGRAGTKGDLQISGLTAGSYVVTVRADGKDVKRSITVSDGHVTVLDVRDDLR